MPPTEAAPAPLWHPSPARRAASRMQRFLDEKGFSTYDEAWEWSVAAATAGEFWRHVADDLGVHWHREPGESLRTEPGTVAGARWFSGGQLNYAESALRAPAGDPGALAVIARSQTRPDQDLSWADLSDLVARARTGLVAAGVASGDRVAGYLPNIPETLALMLASGSLGAVWTCCAPEMGVAGVLDRFAQVEPTVLVAVDGYRYGDREIDRAAEAEAIRTGLPTLTRAVRLDYLHPGSAPPAGWAAWGDLVAEAGPLEFAALDFDHPLYILFSSGTTGKPKAIVHCHGGILLEHAKALGLHFGVGPGERFFWYTTTGWMMWNFLVSGLLVGAPIVAFDGNPAWPKADVLWDLMASTGTTVGGVGAPYLVTSMKAGMRPGTDHDLRALKTLGSTGSPLPPAAAEWAYREVAGDVLLSSFSGGTDVCTGFVGASPVHDVWAGEISCRLLGAKVEVFDDTGRPVVGREGELVLTAPLPSMPVGFWGDESGARYRAAYFERFPGVWAHGDRATLTDRGSIVITGRSDGTLNRGGVRMGTAELYEVVEGFDEVSDSLVVHLEDRGGGPGELWLFIVEAPETATAGAEGGLAGRIRAALRRDMSPRHAPDHIRTIESVPRTLSGKKLEVPVKRILNGAPPSEALTLASVANPESIDVFVALAKERAGG
ncbi:MAG: acetoacetate--CoA ligase [Acidimicrobiales bacterium]